MLKQKFIFLAKYTCGDLTQPYLKINDAAIRLVFQYWVTYEYLFSGQMRHQLIWSRTVNVHGKLGKNIALDLHMEHLNRVKEFHITSWCKCCREEHTTCGIVLMSAD